MKLRLLLPLALVVAACDPTSDCDVEASACTDDTVRAAEAASTRDVGVVGKPANVATRDGGESVLVGGKILWTFGDTFFNPKSVDGVNFRTSTAALADPANPLAVTEPLDANGAPYAAFDFTAEELAYNAARDPTQDRIGLWFGGLVPDGGGALAFYLKLIVKPNLDYTYLGVGTARFAANATHGTRTDGLLFDFTKGEPRFERPMLHEGTLYLYGELPGRQGQFGVAKAPLAQATVRSAYTFWNGSAWTSNVAQTAAVLTGIPGQMSAAWNPYLGAFLAVNTDVSSQSVIARTAARPEGPWGQRTVLFAQQPAASGFGYAGQEHVALRKQNGKVLFVTYYRSLPGFLQGELRAVEVTLK